VCVPSPTAAGLAAIPQIHPPSLFLSSAWVCKGRSSCFVRHGNETRISGGAEPYGLGNKSSQEYGVCLGFTGGAVMGTGPSEGMMRCRRAWPRSRSCVGRRHQPPKPPLRLCFGRPQGHKAGGAGAWCCYHTSTGTSSNTCDHFHQCGFPSLGTVPRGGRCCPRRSEVPHAFRSLAEHLVPGTTLLGGI